jgi:hypothetical protein
LTALIMVQQFDCFALSIAILALHLGVCIFSSAAAGSCASSVLCVVCLGSWLASTSCLKHCTLCSSQISLMVSSG